MAVFATALQNICSDLVTTGKKAPAGLNVLISFNYSKLQMFLYYLSDNNIKEYRYFSFLMFLIRFPII